MLNNSTNNEIINKTINENDNLISPLVFQCLKCRNIVGDSFSFSSSNNERQTISLHTATNIKRIHEFHTSKNGYDIGSTYIIFVCQICEVYHFYSYFYYYLNLI